MRSLLLGVVFAMAGMFLVGVLISHFVSCAQLSGGAFQSALFALTVNLLQIYILNGNLVYTCFNLALVGLFLFGVYCICHIPWATSLDAGGLVRRSATATTGTVHGG